MGEAAAGELTRSIQLLLNSPPRESVLIATVKFVIVMAG
jgi:hypothetical protein